MSKSFNKTDFDLWFSKVVSLDRSQDVFSESVDVLLDYYIELFNNPSKYFLDIEVAGQVIDFLVGFEGRLYALLELEIAEIGKMELINSIYVLYKDLFQKQCANILMSEVYDDSVPHTSLDTVCYMFWDILPYHGKPENLELKTVNEAILKLFNKIIYLDSISCIESGLHGLGEWQLYYKSEVKMIIDKFIEEKGHSLPPNLLQYAKNASRGRVL